MLKFLVPRIAAADLPAMLGIALAGAAVAGAYGIMHDQLTYTISEEYFTKLKFKQFRAANFGFPDRVFVVEIGFLASWWVGLICGWFLSRRLIPNQPRQRALGQIVIGIVIIFASGIFAGWLGWTYGLWRGPNADYSAWAYVLALYDVDDSFAFIRVAYIHNASYLGGLIGLFLALALIRPNHTLDSIRDDDSRRSPVLP